MDIESRLQLKAKAKLNLCLDVIGQEGELHALDTVIVPIDLFDTVTMEKAEETAVTYGGKESPYPSDSVKKTVELLKDEFCGGVRIDIIKRIPEKAGVGGSSADAAAVARGLEKLFGFKAPSEVLERIGSDVPAMHADVPCRMAGTGRNIEPIRIAEKIRFVLVIPDGGVGTKECFALYDEVGGRADTSGVAEALARGEYFLPQNALFESAARILPEISAAKALLEEAGFSAGMTGSGSGVFGYEYSETKFREKTAKLMSLSGANKFKIITV